MLFNRRRNFVCVFCGGKKDSGKRYRHRCGICDECMAKLPFTARGGCFEAGHNVKYVISAMFYEGVVRDAIMRYKFEGWQCCDAPLGDIIGGFCADFPHLCDFDKVFPVPLSRERFNERGFNQSVPLARAISRKTGVEYDENTLIKIRHTSRQSRLSSRERANNVKDAYQCQKLCGERVIIVDDIYTTGITMEECAKTVIKAGASEVVGVTLSIKPNKEKNPFIRY